MTRLAAILSTPFVMASIHKYLFQFDWFVLLAYGTGLAAISLFFCVLALLLAWIIREKWF